MHACLDLISPETHITIANDDYWSSIMGNIPAGDTDRNSEWFGTVGLELLAWSWETIERNAVSVEWQTSEAAKADFNRRAWRHGGFIHDGLILESVEALKRPFDGFVAFRVVEARYCCRVGRRAIVLVRF